MEIKYCQQADAHGFVDCPYWGRCGNSFLFLNYREQLAPLPPPPIYVRNRIGDADNVWNCVDVGALLFHKVSLIILIAFKSFFVKVSNSMEVRDKVT